MDPKYFYAVHVIHGDFLDAAKYLNSHPTHEPVTAQSYGYNVTILYRVKEAA